MIAAGLSPDNALGSPRAGGSDAGSVGPGSSRSAVHAGNGEQLVFYGIERSHDAVGDGQVNGKRMSGRKIDNGTFKFLQTVLHYTSFYPVQCVLAAQRAGLE